MNSVRTICRRPDLILPGHSDFRSRVIPRSTSIPSRFLFNLPGPTCPETNIPELHHGKHTCRTVVAIPPPPPPTPRRNLQLPILIPTPPNRDKLLNPRRPNPHRTIPKRAR